MARRSRVDRVVKEQSPTRFAGLAPGDATHLPTRGPFPFYYASPVQGVVAAKLPEGLWKLIFIMNFFRELLNKPKLF